MRTVLIGSDFMYDSDGNLKLLEINTALGWDMLAKAEDDADCIDLTGLDTFIKEHSFKNIHYIGEIQYLSLQFKNYCEANSITYEFHGVGGESITIPYIEDNDDTLIIRSSYDTTALVDDTYCRDKVEFMKLIKNESYGSKFAYIDDTTNELVNTITEIKDNGVHPNFILKSRYPGYDIDVYPKLFKVSTIEELNNVIENNVNSDYFLMEFYVNLDKTWNGHQKIIRSLNILTPPNLESIQIGQYTKLNPNFLLDNVTYNETTFELNSNYRTSYVSALSTSTLPKLLDTDLVELADGTFKTPEELQIGDVLKTIDVPNPESIDTGDFHTNYLISYEEFIAGTTYSTNPVIDKRRINTFVITTTITFDDETTWYDAESAFYLVNRNNDIQFLNLHKLAAGDIILLIDTSSEELSIVPKTVASLKADKVVFSGWEIEVEGAHLFLTKNGNTTLSAEYVTIEHNSTFCPNMACYNCNSTCGSCPKTVRYCIGTYTCSTTKCL